MLAQSDCFQICSHPLFPTGAGAKVAAVTLPGGKKAKWTRCAGEGTSHHRVFRRQSQHSHGWLKSCAVGRMEKHEMVERLALSMSSPLKHWTKMTPWRKSDAVLFINRLQRALSWWPSVLSSY